ncbi:MAG: TIGR03557 family F420-dependent LLM class oxidoreductase [Thermoleophilia bacterium]|nr:TIGR03557 family F420-dependent LLM class oxidoreductase [Thermoleophilia bacterium]
MPEYGYQLSAEEHAPLDLVRNAGRAEEEGFAFALVSDHFHPWLDRQGHSAFVWNVVGAIAATTERLELGTGVTCPLIRIHPAIVAHAAATSATMMPGRFFLGVGTGENLNEHVLGDRWPAPDERLELLEEAVELMRTLWEGGYQTFRGDHYVVEQARLYDLPDEPIRVMVAAAQPNAAELAGRIGDGLVSTAPDREVVSSYGGDGPKYGKVTICWAESEEEAKQTAFEWFSNTAAPGELATELALPRHYEQVAEVLSPEDVGEKIACGPDPDRVLEQAKEYEDAGFDHLYFHQVGPDQDGFFRFWREELRGRL